ncbi:MAG: hypothetical protein HKN23_11730 [Verrucomicrobiales bacterium]|nr:hypothetical protein [Verrucomicrobiales bacterium]
MKIISLAAVRTSFGIATASLLSLVFGPMPAEAANEELGFIERFALAEDREDALKELIPGTEDFYYYHALHAQNQGNHAEVKNLMEPWIKRYGETARVWELRHREALIRYPQQQKQSLDYLRSRLGLSFNHEQQRLNQKPNYPTSLNQNLISWETFRKEAFTHSSTLSLISETGLDRILRSDLELNEKQRRDLLARIKYPDYPRLVGLIAADLRSKESRGFGEFPIHNRLLPEQLDQLLELRPQLLNDPNFVNAKIRKLHPNADVDWRREAEAREAYLTRVWDFTKTLQPAFNSLKGHSLYQLLQHYQREGEYPRDLFLTYIKLPRPMHYVEPKYINQADRRRYQVDLNANYQAVTSLPPIGNDEVLVRDYLLHFFVEDDSWEGYSTFIRESYLKPLFAEAKLTNGIGDPEQWFSMLSPTAVQNLKDRVDIEFAPSNREQYGQDDVVTLDVFVKNVDQLMVKVYELNALNYFLDQRKELNTDLQLDGLIANTETEHKYGEAPILRKKRTFEFESLKGKRGVWVVELIGNGMSSRALIRKGRLQYLSRTTGAGTLVTVLDANNQPAKDPAVWFAGRKYEPNKSGTISLPFSNQPGTHPIVLTDGNFATLEQLQVPSENYRLEAGFYVQRETILPSEEAKVVVRPSLTVNGNAVPVSVLEEVKLTIRSTDLDGITAVEEVPEFELKNDEESVHTFRVPNRLQHLSFSLEAKISAVSRGGAKEPLVAHGEIPLNTIDQRELVADMHLSQIDGAYVLEVLGKTGEPMLDRAVNVAIDHRDFQRNRNFNLKTDDNGRINLGALEGIVSVSASGNWLDSRRWILPEDEHTLASSVHGVAGGKIEIPAMDVEGNLERSDFAIFETRGGTLVRDDFAKAEFKDGLIQIEGLTPGDYEVVLRNPNRTVTVRVTESDQSAAGYALSEYRHLEVKNASPLQISSVELKGENVVIQTENASPTTRVHILVTRFLPEYRAYDRLNVYRLPEPFAINRGSAESLYVSGRDIGEEYRYILERRSSKIFPGNMLSSPGLLLNPWALRDTQTTIDDAKAGEAYRRSKEAAKSERGASAAKADSEKENRVAGSTTTNLDFLAIQGVVSYNLTPDENGVISFKRSELKDRQHLHVIAIDLGNVAYRQTSFDEGEGVVIRDLRLQTSLNLEKHFTQRRKVTMLKNGETLEIPDLRASDLETYDTVSSVYGAMMGVNGDATFGEFGFVLTWPELPIEEKHRLYSKYACHELNFFLSRKDVEFFEQVVQPYLENKRDKTFMDDYLIGADLAEYVQPWKFGRLNTPERILLARRLGGGETESTARHIRELFELQPVNPEREQFLFQSALRGRRMSGGRQWGGFAGRAVNGKMMFSNNGVAGEGAGGGGSSDGGAGGAPGDVSGLGRGNARFQQLAKKSKNAPAPASAPMAPGANREVRKAVSESETLSMALSDNFAADVDKDGQLAAGAEIQMTGKKLRQLREESEADAINEEMAEVEDFGLADEDLKRVRGELAQAALFRKLESTKEWAENNYYHLPIEQQLANLIGVNAFWKEFAAWEGEAGFYSREFPGATSNFAEMMLALSVMDVPFEAKEHDIEIENNTFTLKAKSPVIVFHEEIEESPVAEDKPPILISQNFFRNDDRYENIAGEQVDKFVTDEFLTGVLYGCQVVVTNPTSSTQKLDLLLQIPQGSLPVMRTDYTKSQHVRLDPFSTQKVDYYFYFPVNSGDGTFAHYPVHLAKEEEIVAWADSFQFKVVDQLSKIDEASWEYLSQFGTDRQVLDYLAANNIERLNLGLIAWRCRKDVDFFRTTIELLDNRHKYNDTLYSYGIFHNHTAAARQYLLHREDFLQQCGQWIETELVSIAPVERHWFQQLEYKPLVNARAHRLGRDRKILNDRFRDQYLDYMKVLTYKPEFDGYDNIAAANYLFTQDRVEEGLNWFGKVKPDDVESQLQHDYLQAYASLYRDEPDVAGRLAAKYEDYPVERWQQKFAQVADQVAEIGGADPNLTDNEDRDQQQDQLADKSPGFEIASEGQKVTIDYRNLDKVTVNYYEMDLEFLFSSKPFVSGDSGQFSYIKPNESAVQKLPNNKSTLEFKIPNKYASKNVLVEVVGAGEKRSTAVFANTLKVDVTENYGRLQVRGEEGGKPLSKVYVKVYSRFDDGSVKFFKDGYTDLRGKFDYVSLNTDELERVEKFSLLIMSEKDGALVREAVPPQR